MIDIQLSEMQISMVEDLVVREINRLERTAREVNETTGYYAAESYYKVIAELKEIYNQLC